MNELPKLIIIEYLPDVKKYRLNYPYFIWKDREYHPGTILDLNQLDEIKQSTSLNL